MQRIDRATNLEQPVGRFYPEIALLNSLNRNHLVEAGDAMITEWDTSQVLFVRE